MKFVLFLIMCCVVLSSSAAGFSLAFFKTVYWDVYQPLFILTAATTLTSVIASLVFMGLCPPRPKVE